MSNNIKIEVKTQSTKAGNLLVEHPATITAGAWNRVTIAVLKSGQPRRYADSIWVAEIAFEGGCGSNMSGYDLPFFVSPPLSFVRELVRLYRGFKDNPGMGDSVLTELVEIKKGETYTIWRAEVTTPFMD